MDQGKAWRATAALMLTAASGFAGLAYQIVWAQQGALWLGHESAAVLAVVAAFFGGISLGALCFGRALHDSAAPLRWYVACESLIAVWALVLAAGFRPATAVLLAIIGPEPSVQWHWAVAFGGTMLLLLPSTAAMGLSLPALERIASRTGSSIFGGLYAANTLGAVLGVLATAFWLIPTHGLTATASGSALVNLLCAASALLLFRGTAARRGEGENRLQRAPRRAALLRLAMTGLLGIGYEVVALRVLSEVTEETVYTFACALAVYLVGTTLGAAAYQRWWSGRAGTDRLNTILPVALCCASLLGAAGLWFAESLRIALGAALGSSLIAAIGTEAMLAASVFALPTFVMGALFSHLCTVANDNGAGFGEAMGWNGAGAALAPAVFGVMAVPALGAKWSLLLLSAGYLAVLPRRAWRWSLILPPLAATLLLALLAPRLAFIDVPPGGRLISYEEGASAAVSVVEDGEGVARLRIDNRQQEGSSATRWVDGRQAWLPLLLHPAPQRVLFLGLGTGITASTATLDARVRVDAVELLPEVIAASSYFTRAMATDASTSRLHLIAVDARHYVRTTDRHYDVIVSDNFHPARSGAGSLYTLEHFQAVRARLAAGGIFCQWLPLHQLDLGTLRSIVQSFLAAYPHAAALLASNSLQTPVLGLVGRADDGLFNVAELRARLANTALSQTWAKSGIEDELALLGSFVAGPATLRSFAADAPLNTDDLPIVAYRAPRITYAPDSLPRDRLIELLREFTAKPADLFELPADRQWPLRLSAYWAARNLYVEAGRDVQPTSDARQMLSQVQAPLLAVLRRSPDFRPAYDPLLRMAAALAGTDSRAARTLLTELVRLQPDRPEAARMLSEFAN